MYAAFSFSLVSLRFQAEKGTLPPLECLSFANTIQADLTTCELASATVPWHRLFFALPQKSVHILGAPKKESLESPKWHWLI